MECVPNSGSTCAKTSRDTTNIPLIAQVSRNKISQTRSIQLVLDHIHKRYELWYTLLDYWNYGIMVSFYMVASARSIHLYKRMLPFDGNKYILTATNGQGIIWVKVNFSQMSLILPYFVRCVSSVLLKNFLTRMESCKQLCLKPWK